MIQLWSETDVGVKRWTISLGLFLLFFSLFFASFLALEIESLRDQSMVGDKNV
jgi:hypothetical protein